MRNCERDILSIWPEWQSSWSLLLATDAELAYEKRIQRLIMKGTSVRWSLLRCQSLIWGLLRIRTGFQTGRRAPIQISRAFETKASELAVQVQWSVSKEVTEWTGGRKPSDCVWYTPPKTFITTVFVLVNLYRYTFIGSGGSVDKALVFWSDYQGFKLQHRQAATVPGAPDHGRPRTLIPRSNSNFLTSCHINIYIQCPFWVYSRFSGFLPKTCPSVDWLLNIVPSCERLRVNVCACCPETIHGVFPWSALDPLTRKKQFMNMDVWMNHSVERSRRVLFKVWARTFVSFFGIKMLFIQSLSVYHKPHSGIPLLALILVFQILDSCSKKCLIFLTLDKRQNQ